MTDNAMVNSTSNITTEGATVIQYEVILDGILLLISAFVIVLDLLVIAAVIADSYIAQSIRWILANILAAGIVGALGSALRHVIHIGSVFEAVSFEINVRHRLTFCKVYLFVMSIGNSGRIVMATFYAVTVFIVVRCWNRPVLATRNTKYFIIAAVLAWLFMTPIVVPILVDEAVTAIFCSSVAGEKEMVKGIIGTVPFLLLSTFPVLFTLCFLVITVCFIKWHTIRENSAASKALLKFGFFVTIGQGINAVAQILCPALFLVLSSHRDRSVIITILGAIFDLSLITTPILIIVFFQPVWHKLKKWFRSCCSKCSFGTTAASQDTAQPPIVNS